VDSIRHDILQGCEVEYVLESTPLDTGGAVANAITELNLFGDFLLTNADTWIGSGVTDLSRGPSPSIATVDMSNASRYGRLEFDEFSNITTFVEKSEKSEPGWINAGLCKLSVGFFLPWNGKACSLEKEIFPRLVDEGEVRAIKLQTDFIDIGVPEDYLRFCLWVKSGRLGRL
jgi:NDP-sugar pyrophosphorylase family protein